MSTSNAAKRRVIQGLGANALGQVVNVLTQLVGLPIFLAMWGVELYGEWLILSSLAAFLTLTDVGFASAAANEMTIRVARDDRQGAWAVYQSMWALLGGAGLLILAGVLAAIWLSPVVQWLPLEQISFRTAKLVLSTFSIHVLITQLATLIYAGFRCDGNYAFGQTISALTRLFEFVSQMIVVLVTGSILGAAASALVVRVVAAVVAFGLLRVKSPWLKWGVSQVSATTTRALVTPALGFVGMPLGHALRSQGTVQVIAAMLGPAAVAIFSAHRAVANIAAQLVTTLINSVWPEFSTAFGANNVDLMRTLHRKACQYSIWFSVAICGLVAVVAPVLIPIWTNGRITCDFELLVLLLVSNLVGSMWRTSSVVHVATNRHLPLAITHVLMHLSVCGVALGLLRDSGLPAVAVVLLIADAAMAGFVVSRSLRIVEEPLGAFTTSLIGFGIPFTRGIREVSDA